MLNRVVGYPAKMDHRHKHNTQATKAVEGIFSRIVDHRRKATHKIAVGSLSQRSFSKVESVAQLTIVSPYPNFFGHRSPITLILFANTAYPIL